VCATFPFHAQKAGVLLLAVALLGVFSGVAFGSSYQLVSRFSDSESVALTTGTRRCSRARSALYRCACHVQYPSM